MQGTHKTIYDIAVIYLLIPYLNCKVETLVGAKHHGARSAVTGMGPQHTLLAGADSANRGGREELCN